MLRQTGGPQGHGLSANVALEATRTTFKNASARKTELTTLYFDTGVMEARDALEKRIQATNLSVKIVGVQRHNVVLQICRPSRRQRS